MREALIVELARSLIGVPWLRVFVQNGELSRKSRQFPGAWLTGSLIVNGCSGVIFSGDSHYFNGIETFYICVNSSQSDYYSRILRESRPSYKVLSKIPRDMKFIPKLEENYPISLEVGFNKNIMYEKNSKSNSLLWCQYSGLEWNFLIYADHEMPCGVGITGNSAAIWNIKNHLGATRTECYCK